MTQAYNESASTMDTAHHGCDLVRCWYGGSSFEFEFEFLMTWMFPHFTCFRFQHYATYSKHCSKNSSCWLLFLLWRVLDTTLRNVPLLSSWAAINNKTGNITQHWGAFANHCCRGKTVSFTPLSVCVLAWVRACWCPGAWACACGCALVALRIHHAVRMSDIVLSFVTFLVPPHFSTLSHKRRDFQKEKGVNHKKVCFLYDVCLKHFSF
jgi:hypothetical protein